MLRSFRMSAMVGALTLVAALPAAQSIVPAYPAPQDGAPATSTAAAPALAPAEPRDDVPAAPLPYGDILVLPDEATLDLRADVPRVEQLLRVDFGEDVPRPLPEDRWVLLRDAWWRVEALPFRVEPWTRVRVRVGDFRDASQVAHAESLLTRLALALGERLAAEAETAALDGDALLEESQVSLVDPAPRDDEALDPFDARWLADAYSSEPVVAQQQPTAPAGWVAIWSPAWGFWYLPPELFAAWNDAGSVAASGDHEPSVVVVHDTGCSCWSCGAYAYDGHGYGTVGHGYGHSWHSWAFIGHCGHHGHGYWSYGPWWGGPPWYGGHGWCDVDVDVDVDVIVPEPDPVADGEDDPVRGDDDDGDDAPADEPGRNRGHDRPVLGDRTRDVADGRDRVPDGREPSTRVPLVRPAPADDASVVETPGDPGPVTSRRPFARPVVSRVVPVTTPVARVPIASGGLRPRPVVRSSVPLPGVVWGAPARDADGAGASWPPATRWPEARPPVTSTPWTPGVPGPILPRPSTEPTWHMPPPTVVVPRPGSAMPAPAPFPSRGPVSTPIVAPRPAPVSPVAPRASTVFTPRSSSGTSTSSGSTRIESVRSPPRAATPAPRAPTPRAGATSPSSGGRTSSTKKGRS